jgi:hypothetical protein
MADDITGRDSFLITEALATALVALEQLPADRQPHSNMDDLRKLLAAAEPANVSLHLARAKYRLRPDLDSCGGLSRIWPRRRRRQFRRNLNVKVY